MIQINNLTANQVDQGFIKKIVQKILKEEGQKGLELSIVFVGRSRIRALNKKYRKKDKATDVLSFSYGNSGEIVICLSRVKENAEKFDLSFKKELTKVLIHGILHLIGYGHGEEKQAKKMEKKEGYYLRKT